MNLKINSLTDHVPTITIEFAPAQIPRRRRLQTAAVALWATLLPITLTTFFLLWFVVTMPSPLRECSLHK